MNITGRYIFLFSTILLSLCSSGIFAQYGHYWTQQFGTRSILLSGSAIAGVEDLGAVYYNPARLAQIENPALLINVNVYEWNVIKIDDAFGNNKNAKESDFGGIPSLTAGSFKLPFLKNHFFAWALLIKQDTRIDVSYQEEFNADLISLFPGEEYLGSEATSLIKAKEEWFSLSWAYPINNKFSIGSSMYLSVIDNQKRNTINLQTLSEDKNVAMMRLHKKYGMDHYNLLFKPALSFRTNKFIFGLSVLTAPIKISGKGAYDYEYLLSSNIEFTENKDVYQTTYQNDLNAQFRSPWSVGLGATYIAPRSRLHISSEWFSAVPAYTMMEANDYVGQSNGEINSFVLVGAAKSIVNAGIGLEFSLNEKLTFYTSFSTDFLSEVDIDKIEKDESIEYFSTILRANLFHYGGGLVLNVNGADITVGFNHVSTKSTVPRSTNFPFEDNMEIFDPDEPLTVKWERWRIIFSFSIPFLNKYQKKIEENLGS